MKKLRIIDCKYGDYKFFFYLQKLLQEGNGEGHRRAEHQQLLEADKAEELEQAQQEKSVALTTKQLSLLRCMMSPPISYKCMLGIYLIFLPIYYSHP